MNLNKFPPAEFQITFLQKIQHLLENSSFQATYKYALLIAIADITIEHGEDQDKYLQINKRVIAERFIELYWGQISPYSSGFATSRPGILFHSDANDHVKVIKDLITLQKHIKSSDLNLAKRSNHWKKAVTSIANTIWSQPIKYLQNPNDQFLYKYPIEGPALILHEHVAYCFRKFSAYIVQLAKSGWVAHIQKTKKNIPIIGTKDDLESFLFGNSRENLEKIRPILMSYHNGKCFYCNKNINQSSDIDHFIPWKKYPRNLVENFVLSCQNCNRSKSDLLGSEKHLNKWLSEIILDKQRMEDISSLGFISDRHCMLAVSTWAYKNGLDTSSNAWIKPNAYEVINSNYIKLLESLG